MAFMIDHTYRKDTKHQPRWGYQARGGAAPSSIIIHTTNNKNKNTAFNGEAEFLRDSPAVSAHFLIGKDGRIVQFLDPMRWQAWHAGPALPAYLNAKSIGIESHVSVGETWTAAQHDACTWLVRDLIAAYGISPELVDTHRAVALPKGRKSDPEGWENEPFYAWRATLSSPPAPQPPITKRYRARRMMISQPEKGGPPYFGELQPGEEVVVNKWYSTGMVHLADGRGFVKLSDLEPV